MGVEESVRVRVVVCRVSALMRLCLWGVILWCEVIMMRMCLTELIHTRRSRTRCIRWKMSDYPNDGLVYRMQQRNGVGRGIAREGTMQTGMVDDSPRI